MSMINRIDTASNIALGTTAAIGAAGGGTFALAGQYAAMGVGAKILAALGIGGLSLLSAPVIAGVALGGLTVGTLAYAYGQSKSLTRKAEEMAEQEGFRDGPE